MLAVGALSVVATGLTTNDLTRFAYDAFSRTDVIECIELVVLYTPFYMLIYGSAVFQLDDYGELRRRLKHVPAPRSEIESIYNRHSSDLLMLVPSYKEDEEVVRQTLMSAALVEYPRRNVVLLIDDPPYPIAQDDVARLAAARRLAAELQRLFDGPARRLRAELSDFIERERYERIDTQKECLHLAALYDFAAGWLELQAANFRICKSTLSHTDQLFIEKILRAPAAAHRHQAFALKKTSLRNTSHLHEYRRLASLFDVEFSSFERKRYANLSHAANKAMNLNSYLALVGKSFRKTVRHDGVYLERCDEQHATLTVPDVKYVVTLDADTLLLSDYALTLINIMEKPGNERLAVAQTPYSAVPNSPVLLERLAGATTDIQFLNHQGMTYFNATSWVGANALLRRAALEDIAVEVEERGHPIKVFIQDKTVVEDTGATVDLILKGWTLYNYPERLSYSATPPDFGALLIQRRRWANGGLLFLPDLLRYIWQRPAARLAEGLMRFYYLMSTAVITVGVLIIIFYRFDDSMVSVWLPFAAFPYQLLYGSDLVLAGYRWTDLPRVYALNMLLIPINLGGALQSLQQICTGRKAAFKRTPKVSGRTSVPFIYLVAEYGLLSYCLFSTTADLIDHRYYHMMFSTLNSVAFLYAVSRFIGFRESWQDAKTFFLSRRCWPEVAFAGRQGPAISGGEQSAFAHLIPIAVEDTERRSLERI
jgi:cellulose synthase/poly-beta-1,6-N-acetylglucosamine synthase-like glycosyltransferase